MSVSVLEVFHRCGFAHWEQPGASQERQICTQIPTEHQWGSARFPSCAPSGFNTLRPARNSSWLPRACEEHAKSSQKQPGAARSSQKQPGAAREQPGAAWEQPGAAWAARDQPGSSQEQPGSSQGAARSSPGAARSSQEQPTHQHICIQIPTEHQWGSARFPSCAPSQFSPMACEIPPGVPPLRLPPPHR